MFLHYPRFLCSYLELHYVDMSRFNCFLFSVYASLVFSSLSWCMQTHVSNPCEVIYVLKPLLPGKTLWGVLGTLLSRLPPLPTFHARRDLITQKLVQRRIVCFYGISARAAVNLESLLQQLLSIVRTHSEEAFTSSALSLWANTTVQDLTTHVGTPLSKGQGVRGTLW